MKLKEEYLREFECQKIKGFIQYFSAEPFVVGLWTEKDIDVFHENATKCAFMGDATGSIALKVGDKMILYYSFLLCNKTKNSEPLVNVEILTDSHDEQPTKNCLQQFITDEKKKYGHKSNAIPIIFTCDMSWPILKATVRSFNNESIEEYIGCSYKIVTGKASTKELPVKPSKLFVHFCLSHIMHAFSRYLKKFFTGNKKKFIMYCSSSVFANSKKWETFRKTIHCLFLVLLAIHKNSHFQQSFDELCAKIKDLGSRDHSGDCLVDHEDLKPITEDIKIVESFETLSEERYYEQSKRSQYYKNFSQ